MAGKINFSPHPFFKKYGTPDWECHVFFDRKRSMLFFASAAGRSPHGEAGGNRLPGADIRPFLHRLNSGRVRSGSAITGKAQRGRTGQKACKESFHHVDFPSFFESGLSYRHIEYRTTVFRALSDFRKGLVKYQNTAQRRPV